MRISDLSSDVCSSDLQHRVRQSQYVLDRGREAAVYQRAGTHCQHQGLTGARPRAPGDLAAHLLQLARIRPAVAHDGSTEARRVGKAGFSKVRTMWSTDH